MSDQQDQISITVTRHPDEQNKPIVQLVFPVGGGDMPNGEQAFVVQLGGTAVDALRDGIVAAAQRYTMIIRFIEHDVQLGILHVGNEKHLIYPTELIDGNPTCLCGKEFDTGPDSDALIEPIAADANLIQQDICSSCLMMQAFSLG